MTIQNIESIVDILGQAEHLGQFVARRTATPDDLVMEVKGCGPLRFPISRAQAKQLCAIARSARYGQGERTLLDRRVRDTWEIPRSRVKIDQRRWKKTLAPTLDALRADLGLPEGSRLKAELHKMLVYAPGQFFLPHQDSERADEMVGTLVVLLPGTFKGGTFVIEHQGERVTYRGSHEKLTFIAFYADCQHEVTKVKSGYRLVLAYNLIVEKAPEGDVVAEAALDPARISALAFQLREHFETPVPRRRQREEPKPPSRLVYFLDHQYTQRGLDWSRLKGADIGRAALLLAAAEESACEAVLALANIHETRSCEELDWESTRRSWDSDDDDDWFEDEPMSALPEDDDELGELIDSEILLTWWRAPGEKRGTSISSHVGEEETCSTLPTAELVAHASEYEGYTGNAGNTMDRWYKRTAIVLFPRERAFAVRAEAAPAWALETLDERIRAGRTDEAQALAKSMLESWRHSLSREEIAGFFEPTLELVLKLGDPELAFSLLEPFSLELITARRAKEIAALAEQFGKGPLQRLLSTWSEAHHAFQGSQKALEWICALPKLCRALIVKAKGGGQVAASALLEDRWTFLRKEIESALHRSRPSDLEKAMNELTLPLFAILESVEVAAKGNLSEKVATYLAKRENEKLLPCLVNALRAAAKAGTELRVGDRLRRVCIEYLEERLALPGRKAEDWSIRIPESCSCGLCTRLEAFLLASAEVRLEWPLAKDGRQHIHSRIDAFELPIRHETRRSGRPYTLELTKLPALHEKEEKERQAWTVDLEWLKGTIA